MLPPSRLPLALLRCPWHHPLLVAAIVRHGAPSMCTAAPYPPRPLQTLVGKPHPATVGADDLLQECEVRHTRGSGPGGQHRNKVATAVVITHTPTGVVGRASESRSQQTNLKAATLRLRNRLAVECRTTNISDEAGDGVLTASALWSSRRTKQGQLQISESHSDFPAMLSEALDAVWLKQDAKAAADALGVSTSQMVKFLSKEPPALQLVNAMRASKGLGPLRTTR